VQDISVVGLSFVFHEQGSSMKETEAVVVVLIVVIIAVCVTTIVDFS